MLTFTDLVLIVPVLVAEDTLVAPAIQSKRQDHSLSVKYLS